MGFKRVLALGNLALKQIAKPIGSQIEKISYRSPTFRRNAVALVQNTRSIFRRDHVPIGPVEAEFLTRRMAAALGEYSTYSIGAVCVFTEMWMAAETYKLQEELIRRLDISRENDQKHVAFAKELEESKTATDALSEKVRELKTMIDAVSEGVEKWEEKYAQMAKEFAQLKENNDKQI